MIVIKQGKWGTEADKSRLNQRDGARCVEYDLLTLAHILSGPFHPGGFFRTDASPPPPTLLRPDTSLFRQPQPSKLVFYLPTPVGLGLGPIQYSLGLHSPQKKEDEPSTMSSYQPASTPQPSSKEDEDDEDSIDVTNEEPPVEPALYPPPPHETVYETSARLLFMAVKWAKNLPSFASLPFRDQVILLEECWSELFLLNAVQWCLPLESSPLFNVSDHLSGLPNGKASQIAAEVRTLNDTLLRFRTVGVDPAEFACLKAIVLFRAETRGLKDPLQVENLQDQAQVMLCQHTRGRHPGQSPRFGRLLLMLPLLRTVPTHRVEFIFFQRTIGNTPMEKVLCDMYKN
ncbi:unnamed protein product [Nezara viridula]|uniref:NR LBD domain-containing protein n=1 Tax=Nezara viridula TaxID=85310 RepID=A0A9P0E290_NEZVI|nr:unnamed protein product [Nezara viridula]